MKAITFGSAMVDIIAVLESSSIEQISFSNASEQFLLVEPGRKVEASSISTHIGGGGLNTAVSLARLGCDVFPIVKTGDDPSSDHVFEHCEANNIKTDLILKDREHATGSAVMIASHEKNAAIFTQRGANTTFVKSDLDHSLPLEADIVHAAPLSGNSAKCLPDIALAAEDAGAFFSCNPGIRQISTKGQTVLEAAKHMSLISLNEVEAAALVTCLSAIGVATDWRSPVGAEPVIKGVGGTIPLAQFCEVLSGHGTEHIVLTFGAEGAFFYENGKLHHQPIVPANVAGTAGAGDSFVSTLAWALKSDYPAEDALLLAAHNASSVVSHVNTTDGLLTLDDLKIRAGL